MRLNVKIRVLTSSSKSRVESSRDLKLVSSIDSTISLKKAYKKIVITLTYFRLAQSRKILITNSYIKYKVVETINNQNDEANETNDERS